MLTNYLSAAAGTPAPAGRERMPMTDELPRQFRLSMKTVSRRRRRGLADRRVLVDGGMRTGFIQNRAERFVADQAEPVRRVTIHEARAARIMDLPLDCIDSDQFLDLSSRQGARELLAPPPENNLATKRPSLPGGLPAYMAGLYDVPLLTREQESHLFRKMNFLKHRAGKLRESLNLEHPKKRLMDQIERLYEESVATRNQIISANLRLVVAIAKRYVGPAADFFELVSDGNVSLMQAVEKFDYSRGNRFSTYATWAIVKNFARSIPVVIRRRDRFRTSHSELLGVTVDLRTDEHEQESEQLKRESHVRRILGCLDERELQIVTGRFGLARGQAARTLKEIGAVIGVSKERIRQIQTRAMGKLRNAFEEERIDLGGTHAGPASNPPSQRNPAPCGTNTGGDQ